MNRKAIQDQIDNAKSNGKSRSLIRINNARFLLQVTPSGVKSWIYRYTIRGKTRAMGLGPVDRISFEEAQKSANKIRVLLDAGTDPLEEKERFEVARRLAEEHQEAERKRSAVESITFQQCAEMFIDRHKRKWRSKVHASQWPTTLKTYVYPVFGNKPVKTVHIEDVKNAINPLWDAGKDETFHRVRARIAKILSYATVKGFRSGDNPAKWKDYLETDYVRGYDEDQSKHHPALPYEELPAFYKTLENTEGVGALLMRFVILTWSRTTEARAAEWTEINFEEATWTRLPKRMKSNRLHRVPLSEPALEILRILRQFNEAQSLTSKYIFNGQIYGQCPSQAIMLSLLKRLGRTDITPHGFRSCGRDYMAQETSFPREIQEAALAHKLKDKTEAAYQRGDYLKKRREMMEHWGRYCTSGKGSNEK